MAALLPVPPVETSAGNYFVSTYPPFSCWRPEYIPKFLHALTSEPTRDPLGLHVHIPFCRERCEHCNVHVYSRRRTLDLDLYVDAILREFASYLHFPALQDRTLQSVYFGGGSPSHLSAEQIRRLIAGLQEQKSWEAVKECTFACDPATLTPEKLRLLKALGVTRISLGFQSLNDAILRRNGRSMLASTALRAFRQARRAGFDEITVELVAGLQGESDQTWRQTVNQVIESKADCVLVHQLEVTAYSALFEKLQAGRSLVLPDWPTKRRWVAEAFRICESEGYTIAGGCAAVRDPKSWRFIHQVECPSHGSDLLALGESAFGYIHGVHYRNIETLDGYLDAIAEGKLPLRRAFRLLPEHRVRREMIFQLKTGEVDAGYFRRKFKVEVMDEFEEPLQELLEKNLIEIDGERIRVKREGLLQLDWLLPAFYEHGHGGIRRAC